MRRLVCAAAACVLGLSGLGLAGAERADAVPRISSFYARDEGRQIQLKVNWCDRDADVTDSFSATFRMWDENYSDSVKVLERRVSGRIYNRCGSAYLKIPDTFANGTYSANVGVTNRTQGTFTRIGIRYFRVS